MNRVMAEAAGEKNVLFADAGRWEIGLAFDQVHFSVEGHRVFADRMEQVLREIKKILPLSNKFTVSAGSFFAYNKSNKERKEYSRVRICS